MYVYEKTIKVPSQFVRHSQICIYTVLIFKLWMIPYYYPRYDGRRFYLMTVLYRYCSLIRAPTQLSCIINTLIKLMKQNAACIIEYRSDVMSLITVRKVEQAMWPRRVSKTCTNVRVIPSAAAATSLCISNYSLFSIRSGWDVRGRVPRREPHRCKSLAQLRVMGSV